VTPEIARCPITPATKVAELLECWPELEPVLVAQAPAFRRLKNPVLRRTVARVTTLEQAAGVGGVAVRDLVAALRRAAGLDDAPPGESGLVDGGAVSAAPEWVSSGRVVATVDAEALLDAGEVPLPVVNEKARGLGPGELLRIDSGFRPAPLVESIAKQGFLSYVREASPGRFETFVSRG
jgi:hypothetical protein